MFFCELTRWRAKTSEDKLLNDILTYPIASMYGIFYLSTNLP